jgi:SPP1 gp7 family putative phage head morphogenesis protein
MPTANEKLLDRAINHAIDLGRYSNGVVRRIIATLNRFDASLVEQIAQALLRMQADSFTVERLNAMLESARLINAEAYRVAYGQIPEAMRDLAGYEAVWQVDSLRAAFPTDARALIAFNRVTAEQAYAAAFSRPFQGRLLRDWATSGEQGRMQEVRNVIRSGFMEGQTTDQIVRRIRGTRARQYRDGILDRSRRSVETMVRTALSHTAATARDEVFKANGDVIKALTWVATLDSRTSPFCRVRDGLRYTADGAHRPIGHKVPWAQGPGRSHFGCRSVAAPVTKSFREMGLDIDEISPATRASMDGQVPADLTYSQWLGRQSAARQDEILGPERGRLIRAGGLAPEMLYSPRGDFLTLDQLRARDASAFRKVGL